MTFIFNPIPSMGQHFTLGVIPAQAAPAVWLSPPYAQRTAQAYTSE